MDWITHRHQTSNGLIEEQGPASLLADHATEFTWKHLLVRPGDRVAEPGCGTGVLSLFCARGTTGPVVGTDIDRDALAAARSNAVRNGITNVEFREGSLLEPVSGPLDLVVALLPHKPAPAAFHHRYYGGPDGTDLLLAVIGQAADRLSAGGRLVLYLNSIANPRRVLAAMAGPFAVRLLAEKPRPFTRAEFEGLTPGMMAHLEAMRALGEAEFQESGGEGCFTARLYEGVRRDSAIVAGRPHSPIRGARVRRDSAIVAGRPHSRIRGARVRRDRPITGRGPHVRNRGPGARR